MKLPLGAVEASKVAENLRLWYSRSSPRSLHPKHTQIVNPILCHQVLERLAPSLERHRGCDIIDISPGVSLWSQHLHELLQPRRHILAEPDRDLFAPYLNPLLEQPNSRYKWTDKKLKDILDDSTLLGAPPPIAEDDRFQTENPGLLVTINFSDQNIKTMQPDARFFNDYYVSLFGLQSDLFKRGLFRVLAWLPDKNKYSLVPRSVNLRSKQATRYEAMSYIKEVAGASALTEDLSKNQRSFPLRVEDMDTIRQAETASGLIVPSGRMDAALLPPTVHIHPSVESWRTTESTEHLAFHDELLTLDSQVEKLYPTRYQEYQPYWRSLGRRIPNQKGELSPVVTQWVKLYSRARTLHTSYWASLRIANESRAIEREWLDIDAQSDTKALAELKRRHEANVAAINKQTSRNAILIRKLIDDYRAYDRRVLSWYRRPYNPLIVNPRDFGKGRTHAENKVLALVDMEPKPSFRKIFDTDAKWRSFDFMLARLTHTWSNDIPTALEQLVFGGVDAFIETIPSLRDVRKGGLYDHKEIRFRTLPVETMFDIALAYHEWPFRLADEKLWTESFKSKEYIGTESLDLR